MPPLQGNDPRRDDDKLKHVDYDQRVAIRFVQLIERVAILEAAIAQLSDPGSRTATPAGATADASPGSASTSGSGSRPTLPGTTAPIGATSPDPDPKSPPTPPEEATAGPGGAEGSNDGTEADAAAGTSLGDVTEAPAAFPPAAGATKRVGRGSGDVGDSTVSAPADTNRSRPVADLGRETTGRLHLVGTEPPDYGRFTR